LLKKIANKTSLEIVESDKLTKDLLSSLLANAASSVGAESALLRYVELDKLRTEHEVVHSIDKSDRSLKVHNRDLKKLHESGAAHAFLKAEDGREVLVVPSDHRDKNVKAFLVITADPSKPVTIDASLLKVFANQAELLHYSLAEQRDKPVPPLELVRQAEESSLGEIS
jgi:hypothetical protein